MQNQEMQTCKRTDCYGITVVHT